MKETSDRVVNPPAVSLVIRRVRNITMSSLRRRRTEHMYHGQQYTEEAICDDCKTTHFILPIVLKTNYGIYVIFFL